MAWVDLGDERWAWIEFVVDDPVAHAVSVVIEPSDETLLPPPSSHKPLGWIRPPKDPDRRAADEPTPGTTPDPDQDTSGGAYIPLRTLSVRFEPVARGLIVDPDWSQQLQAETDIDFMGVLAIDITPIAEQGSIVRFDAARFIAGVEHHSEPGQFGIVALDAAADDLGLLPDD